MPETQMKQQGDNIVFISAASGGGKQATIQLLREMFGELLWFSVSYTTREPRPDEIHGVHYYFVTEDVFLDLIENGVFLEYAKVYGKAWYGTPLQPMLDALAQDKIVIGDADVQGVAIMKEFFPKAAFFFLYVQEAELRRRLIARGVNETDMGDRIRESHIEMIAARKLYPPTHLIPSQTLRDKEGNVLLDEGVRKTTRVLLWHLRHHALYRWGTSPAFRALIEALHPHLDP